MIQKIVPPGGGFRGVLNYLLAPEKQAVVLGGNLTGTTPRELAAEFGHTRSLNPRVQKPVFHASLSLSPEESLTESDWRQATDDYLQAMGYGSSPWVAIQHHDTEHPHVHIVASRIDDHGRRVRDFQERKRGEEKVRELEAQLGLERVAPSRESQKVAPTREDLATFERTGTVTAKAYLQSLLDASLEDRPTLSELLVRLEAQRVQVHANVQSTGRVAGWSFEIDGVALKASSLGRGYTLSALEKAGRLDYDPDRDLSALQALARSRLPGPSSEPLIGPSPEAPLEADVPPRGLGAEVLEGLDRQIKAAYREVSTLREFQNHLERLGIGLHLELRGEHITGWRFQLAEQEVDPLDLGPHHDPVDVLQTGRLRVPPGDREPLSAAALSVGEPSSALDLRRLLDRAAADQVPLSAAVRRLEGAGFRPRLTQAATGELLSWRFSTEAGEVLASHLGPGYQLSELLAAGSISLSAEDNLEKLRAHAPVERLSHTADLRRRLDEALADSADLTATVSRLHHLGVHTVLESDSQGRLLRWSFVFDKETIFPHQLGPGYELASLQQDGRLGCDPRSDAQRLRPFATLSSCPSEDQIRSLLAQATRDRPTLEALTSRLAREGLTLRLERDVNGRPAAWSFERDGHHIPAAALGADHTLAAIEAKGALALPSPPVPVRQLDAGAEPPSPGTFEGRLRSTLAQALRETPSFGAFVARLRSHDIEVRPTRDTSGRVLSWSFAAEGRSLSASRLGNEFTFESLTASGRLDYDPARDHWALDALPPPPGALEVSRLREAVSEALDVSPRFDDTVRRLESVGVVVRPRFDSRREITGWHFELDGQPVEATALGHDFSFAALRHTGRLDYDPPRDNWLYDPLLRSSLRAAAPATALAPDAPPERAPLRLDVREKLLEAAHASATVSEYLEAAQALGIQPIPRLALSGEVRSLGYRVDDRFFPAHSLDPSLTWRELQRVHGIEYTADRDLPALRALLDRFSIGRQHPSSTPSHRYVPDLAALYKQAARLTALLRVDEEHARHSSARAKLETAIHRTRGGLDELSTLSTRATQLQRAFEQDLRLAFRPPSHERALNETRRLLAARGHAEAARSLRDHPGDLGRLRGSAVGPAESPERTQAREHLRRASHTLHELGVVRRSIAALETRTADASLALQRLQPQAAARDRSLRQLGEIGGRTARVLAETLALTVAPAPVRSALIGGQALSQALSTRSLAPVQRTLLHAVLPRPLKAVDSVLRAGGGVQGAARGLILVLPAAPRALLNIALALSRSRGR